MVGELALAHVASVEGGEAVGLEVLVSGLGGVWAVGNPEGDVVEPFAVLVETLLPGGIAAEGFDEFELDTA